MEKYVDASDQGVHFLPASELARTDWSLPKAEKLGFHRTICRGIRGAGASLGLGIMPVGQRSPMHSTDAEHLLLGLEGELVWNVEGVRYTMRPRDLLFVGAGVAYEYWNSGFGTAQFIDVIGRVDTWPPQGNYHP